MILRVTIILLASQLQLAKGSYNEVIEVNLTSLKGAVDVFTNQAYRIKLLGINDRNFGPYVHRMMVKGYPQLPEWNFFKAHEDDVLFYGTYPKQGTVDLQIISTSEKTFESTVQEFKLQVQDHPIRSPYELEFKLVNYNIEDLFHGETLFKLQETWKSLWGESLIVTTSKLASVRDIGGRNPLDPRHKEGVLLRFTGSSNFSSELRNLQLEVQKLKNRVPCPRDYKHTSVEWRFRQESLISDWCGFRLIEESKSKKIVSHIDYRKVFAELYPNTFPSSLPKFESLPRETFQDIVMSIMSAILFCVVLLFVLTGVSLSIYLNDRSIRRSSAT